MPTFTREAGHPDTATATNLGNNYWLERNRIYTAAGHFVGTFNSLDRTITGPDGTVVASGLSLESADVGVALNGLYGLGTADDSDTWTPGSTTDTTTQGLLDTPEQKALWLEFRASEPFAGWSQFVQYAAARGMIVPATTGPPMTLEELDALAGGTTPPVTQGQFEYIRDSQGRVWRLNQAISDVNELTAEMIANQVTDSSALQGASILQGTYLDPSTGQIIAGDAAITEKINAAVVGAGHTIIPGGDGGDGDGGAFGNLFDVKGWPEGKLIQALVDMGFPPELATVKNGLIGGFGGAWWQLFFQNLGKMAELTGFTGIGEDKEPTMERIKMLADIAMQATRVMAIEAAQTGAWRPIESVSINDNGSLNIVYGTEPVQTIAAKRLQHEIDAAAREVAANPSRYVEAELLRGSTGMPVEPVAPPVEPVAPPVEPVAPPVEPVAPPVEPVAPPEGPVAPPVPPDDKPPGVVHNAEWDLGGGFSTGVGTHSRAIRDLLLNGQKIGTLKLDDQGNGFYLLSIWDTQGNVISDRVEIARTGGTQTVAQLVASRFTVAQRGGFTATPPGPAQSVPPGPAQPTRIIETPISPVPPGPAQPTKIIETPISPVPPDPTDPTKIIETPISPVPPDPTQPVAPPPVEPVAHRPVGPVTPPPVGPVTPPVVGPVTPPPVGPVTPPPVEPVAPWRVGPLPGPGPSDPTQHPPVVPDDRPVGVVHNSVWDLGGGFSTGVGTHSRATRDLLWNGKKVGTLKLDDQGNGFYKLSVWDLTGTVLSDGVSIAPSSGTQTVAQMVAERFTVAQRGMATPSVTKKYDDRTPSTYPIMELADTFRTSYDDSTKLGAPGSVVAASKQGQVPLSTEADDDDAAKKRKALLEQDIRVPGFITSIRAGKQIPTAGRMTTPSVTKKYKDIGFGRKDVEGFNLRSLTNLSDTQNKVLGSFIRAKGEVSEEDAAGIIKRGMPKKRSVVSMQRTRSRGR